MKTLKIAALLLMVNIIILSSCEKKDANPDEKIFITPVEPWEPTYEDLKAIYDSGYNIIDGHLRLYLMDSLYDLNYLSNIERIDGSLLIYGNRNLKTVDGLNNLEYVQSLYIGIKHPDMHVSNIENLNGLESLEIIEGVFQVTNNYRLENIYGLSNLKHIGGEFLIYKNSILTSMDGLQNLEYISFTDICDNDSLTDFCALKNVLSTLEDERMVQICNNRYNPTVQEIVNGDCQQ